MIEDISFGNITIDGKTYHSDLIIYPDGRIEDGWRRASGHQLIESDIAALLESEPDILIVGSGVYGAMKPAKALKKKMADRGVEFIAAVNQTAADAFNRMALSRKVGACFHLTC